MKIKSIIWLESIIEKIYVKHNATKGEIVEVLKSKPHFLFIEKGFKKGEDVYSALGKTQGGRYMIVFFVYKNNKDVLIISARDMTDKEKKKYAKR